jgi:hypothetical protein
MSQESRVKSHESIKQVNVVSMQEHRKARSQSPTDTEFFFRFSCKFSNKKNKEIRENKKKSKIIENNF